MGRRSIHSPEELRELIIHATTEIVEQDGLEGLSAREIAKRIGYSPGTLYNVFENLDDILLTIEARLLDRLADGWRNRRSGPPQERLRRLTERLLRLHAGATQALEPARRAPPAGGTGCARMVSGQAREPAGAARGGACTVAHREGCWRAEARSAHVVGQRARHDLAVDRRQALRRHRARRRSRSSTTSSPPIWPVCRNARRSGGRSPLSAYALKAPRRGRASRAGRRRRHASRSSARRLRRDRRAAGPRSTNTPNQLSSGTRRCCSAGPHAARGDPFDEGVRRGDDEEQQRAARPPWRPIAAGMAHIDEFQRRAEGLLDMGAHHVDRVDLVEGEVRQEADEQEAGGEPGDAVGAAERIVEYDGRGERAHDAGRYGMPDAAMHRILVKERMQAVAHEQQRPDPQQPHLGDRQRGRSETARRTRRRSRGRRTGRGSGANPSGRCRAAPSPATPPW